MKKLLLLLAMVLVGESSYLADKPISLNLPLYSIRDTPPSPRRDKSVVGFLSPTCRVEFSNYCGSGTIIGFDGYEGAAWVLSCGHLFGKDRMPSNSRKILLCKLAFFYHNDVRLVVPDYYLGLVEFHAFGRSDDISLIRFYPSWIPDTVGIAPLGRKIDLKLISTGCDDCSEPAAYEVDYFGPRHFDYLTRHNSPRLGRSGGGLLNRDGTLVGICSRTSARDGRGIGFYTPLKKIHQIMKEERFGRLLGVPSS